MSLVDPSRMEGYWFDSSHDDVELLRGDGQVRLARVQPPWLVVDQAIASLILGGNWPGRLWRVRVTELGDMSGLVANPGYWRAVALDLLEELPLAILFGPHGDRILALLARIEALTRDEAQCLSARLDADASAAYGRAWARWSQARGQGRSAHAHDWQGVIAAPSGRADDKSPIQSGFLLIHDQLRRRALELDGEHAVEVIIDEEGDAEESLAPLWQDASDAFLYAAMALGAPELVSAEDRAALMRAWDACYGAS